MSICPPHRPGHQLWTTKGKGKRKEERTWPAIPLYPLTAPIPIPLELQAAVALLIGRSPTVLTEKREKGGGKKKGGGGRMWLWMKFDRAGQSDLIECEKSEIVRRVSIPARDLRIFGPIFSHSSSILARERAMVVNLEFIKRP
ncbi:hypothetical protein MLD38_026895 [Melastoma candidum]|uniref:Uncharacterized protein n=1 Tax=Melastoma candidum TaxID=119954 RepID=A0ACB9P1W6_9MYRT|nr:hypothetical protein MLD38_026895 [Melastoma candidum]